jgi:hypothetical protein
MQDYAAQTSVEDRWAIVAYVRALQLSQKATIEDVPEASGRRWSDSNDYPPAEEGCNRRGES